MVYIKSLKLLVRWLPLCKGGYQDGPMKGMEVKSAPWFHGLETL